MTTPNSERDMTQPKDSEQTNFEAMFPVPLGVKYSTERDSYIWIGGSYQEHEDREYTKMWKCWQAAKQSAIVQSQPPLIFVDGGHLREICNGNEMPIYASSEQDEQNRLVPLYDSPTAQLAVPEGLEELKINFILACKALDDLSFSCFAGIGISAPTLKVYNETFAVLEKMRPLCKAMLPAAPTTNISTNT